MKIEKCKSCNYHLRKVADSALCRFNIETEYKVVYLGEVLSCPLETAKKY
jgi:hypothetical protein